MTHTARFFEVGDYVTSYGKDLHLFIRVHHQDKVEGPELMETYFGEIIKVNPWTTEDGSVIDQIYTVRFLNLHFLESFLALHPEMSDKLLVEFTFCNDDLDLYKNCFLKSNRASFNVVLLEQPNEIKEYVTFLANVHPKKRTTQGADALPSHNHIKLFQNVSASSLQRADAELHDNIHVLCRRTNSMLDDVDALEASQAYQARSYRADSINGINSINGIMGSAPGAMAFSRDAGVLPGREWRKVKDDLAGVLEGLEAVHQNVKMELLRQTDAKAIQCGGMIYGMPNDILTSQKSESTTEDWPPIPFEVYANVRKTNGNDDSIWQVVGGMFSKDDWVIIIRQNDKFQQIDQSNIDDVASDDDVDPAAAKEFLLDED